MKNNIFSQIIIVLAMMLPGTILPNSTGSNDQARVEPLRNCVAIVELCGNQSVNVRIVCVGMGFDPGSTCHAKDCYTVPVGTYCRY